MIEESLVGKAVPVVFPSKFEVYGPIAIGSLLSIFGCGAVLIGTIIYLDMFKEGWRVKILLLIVLAFNIAQSACDASRLLKLTVLHAGDFIYFLGIHHRPEEFLSPFFSVIICTIVQVFLAYRCISFARVTANPIDRGKKGFGYRVWGLGILFGLGVALSFGSGLGTAIALYSLTSYTQASRTYDTTGTFPTMATIWLTASAVTDVLISGMIVYELYNAVKNQKRGSRAILAIMRLCLQSGIAVTALQLATLIMYLTQKSSWSDFPSIFISKIYSLTLLFSFLSPRDSMTPHRQHPSPPNPNRPAYQPHPDYALPLSLHRVTDSWRSHSIPVPGQAHHSPRQKQGLGVRVGRSYVEMEADDESYKGIENEYAGDVTRESKGDEGRMGRLGFHDDASEAELSKGAIAMGRMEGRGSGSGSASGSGSGQGTGSTPGMDARSMGADTLYEGGGKAVGVLDFV